MEGARPQIIVSGLVLVVGSPCEVGENVKLVNNLNLVKTEKDSLLVIF